MYTYLYKQKLDEIGVSNTVDQKIYTLENFSTLNFQFFIFAACQSAENFLGLQLELRAHTR